MATRAETENVIVPYRADWRRGRLTSWLTTVDHKRIGLLYIWTALAFFAVGGVLALLLRTQLATPNEGFLTLGEYNEVLTIHGTSMIFLVIVPILAGFGNFLVPLMIGARDMAFPRLNALSYWLYLLGGIVLYLSFFARGGAAESGWTSYATLSTLHSPGRGQDLWILALHILSISSLAGAINFVVTIHNMRARGMTWMRIPLFVWAILTYAWLLVLVLPTLSAGLTMMLLDRQAGTNFFNPAEGGSPILYQHVFWFFGHPEVYIMILPAMGIVSEIIPVFARKPIFGYKAVAYSTVGIAFFSLLVWAHHMFAVGLPIGLQSFFMLSSMVIAVPTGVKIFNWLATLWRGNISFDTPMLWAVGFIGVFTIGGLSGIFLAAFPVDWQLTDSYYVVAHLHYVLFGGSIFAIFGGLYYWWPKMFGRVLDEGLGKLHFWLVLIGFNLTFMPQHFLGLLGMPRRVYTYTPGGLWEVYNMISTIGSYVMGIGMLVFVVNVVRTTRTGRRAGNDPWLGDTLEWYATSPPPPWNFDRIPYIVERPPAARPAPPLAGGGAPVTPPSALGPWARLLAVGALAGTALAVVSGAAGWDTAHRLLAALALAAARRARRPRLALRPAPAPGLRRVARPLRPGSAADGPRRPPCRGGGRLRGDQPALRPGLPRAGAPDGRARRLHHADQAACDVAAPADGRRGRVRRRLRRPGRRHLRRDDGRPGARLRRRRNAQPLPRPRHRQADGRAHGDEAGRRGPRRAGAGARVRHRALRPLVRPARLAGQPADGAARAGREPLLRLRLHALAQALDAAEHRHRRRGGRGAAARRRTRARRATSAGPRS